MADKIISLNPDAGGPAPAKYADILYDFVEPFIDRYPDDVALDDIFLDGLSAWNVAVMTAALPEDDRIVSLELAADELPDNQFFMEMVEYKDEHFAAFNHVYEEFEFTEVDGEDHLMVKVTELNSFFDNIGKTLAKPFRTADSEGVVNRYAIILKAKQPMADWATELLPHEPVDVSTMDSVIYLIELKKDVPSEKHFKKRFDRYFQLELESWHTDKKQWPQRRTYRMFQQWFDVEVCTMVYDTESQPILKF